MSNVKNYSKQGGEKWVIAGELELTGSGKFLFSGKELKPAAGLIDSEASIIAVLKDDFNVLLEKLYAAGLMVADKTALEDAVIFALELLEGAVIGEEQGEYPQGTYDIFSNAINASQGVAEDASATQSEVDTALNTLQSAISTFENAQIGE